MIEKCGVSAKLTFSLVVGNCNLSLVRSTISGHNASHNPVKLNRRDKLGYCNQPLHLNNIQNMVSLFLKRLARLTSL